MTLIDLFPQPDLATTVLPGPPVATWRKNDLYVASNWSWFEIVAATPRDYAAFNMVTNPHGNNGGRLLAVAFGPAGSEQVKYVGPAFTKGAFGLSNAIPLAVPAGTRVSIAAMSWTNALIGAQLHFFPAPLPDLSSLTRADYGPVNLLDGGGLWGTPQNIQWPATAHTKTAWQEIINLGANNVVTGAAGTTHVYQMMGLILSHSLSASALDANAFVFDFATGPAGSEEVFLEGLHSEAINSSDYSSPSITWVPWGRPAGDRLAVRVQARTLASLPQMGIAAIGLR